MFQQTNVTDVESKTLQLLLPDAMSTAEAIMNQSMEFCAQKMRLGDYRGVLQKLQQRDVTACNYCQYSIAKQVGKALGALDQNVNAVYMVDYDATPQDICFAAQGGLKLIHLIVRVERKTSALQSLVEALDDALAQGYAKLLGMDQLKHLLDIQLVDATDVKERIGYGAMLSSLYQRPIRVWER